MALILDLIVQGMQMLLVLLLAPLLTGFVRKVKQGRSNYYINLALNGILTQAELVDGAQGR